MSAFKYTLFKATSVQVVMLCSHGTKSLVNTVALGAIYMIFICDLCRQPLKKYHQ